MRVLLFTTRHHMYANYLVKSLLENEDGYEIVGIIESKVLLPGKGYFESLWKYLRTSGVLFFITQATKMWFFRLGCMFNRLTGSRDQKNIFFSYTRLLKPMGIPAYGSKNVNSRKCQKQIQSLDPDLIIILLFGQILGARTISLPAKGVINFHPSLLPNYRGLMPVFWAMSSNELNGGVTLHFVDTGIDTGPVISRRIVPIRREDTEHSFYARCCVIGKEMLLEAIGKVKTGNISVIKTPKDSKGTYFSVPTVSAVKRFRANGRKFFKLSELMTRFEEL
jgi:folate-dependent phosphoribosylglycinamide formyltransferase PurN